MGIVSRLCGGAVAPMAAGAECLFMLSVGFSVRSAFCAVCSPTQLTEDALCECVCDVSAPWGAETVALVTVGYGVMLV